MFLDDLQGTLRSLVERLYNIQRWTAMQAGGHFAALEQPQVLVEDISAFFSASEKRACTVNVVRDPKKRAHVCCANSFRRAFQ